MNEERATDKQIAAITKAKLHEQPWTLSKREAWKLMDDKFGKGVPPTPQTYQGPGTQDAGAEVVNMTGTVSSDEKPKKSYELTDGNIRIGALTCAIDSFVKPTLTDDLFYDRVKEFEEYIRNGLQRGTS